MTAQELIERLSPDRDVVLRIDAEYAGEMLRQQAEQIDQLEVERLRLVGEVSNRNIRALEGDKSTAAFNTLCDEYEALRLESLQLKAALRWQPASGMLESIEALSNENLALKADAERYQFAREKFMCYREENNDDATRRHGSELVVYAAELHIDLPRVYSTYGGVHEYKVDPKVVDAAIDAMKGKS